MGREGPGREKEGPERNRVWATIGRPAPDGRLAFRLQYPLLMSNLVRNRERRDAKAARRMLENAPVSFRVGAPATWFSLGLKHGPPWSGAEGRGAIDAHYATALAEAL